MWTPELLFLSDHAHRLRGRLAVAAPEPDVEAQLARPFEVSDDAPVFSPRVFELPSDDTLPASELAARFGLDAVDLDILLFAAAARLEPSLAVGIAGVCAPLGVDYPCPLAWLRLVSIGEPARFWAEQYRFGPSRPLRRSGLVELWPRPGRYADPLHAELLVPTDVLGLLRGDRAQDERLVGLVTRHDGLEDQAAPALRPGVQERLAALVQGHVQGIDGMTHRGVGGILGDLVLVNGGRGVGKSAAVRAACRAIGAGCLELHGELAASEPRDVIVDHLGLAVREAALHGEVLLLDGADTLLGKEGVGGPALVAALRRHRALVFVTTRDVTALHPSVRAVALARVELPYPSFDVHLAIWQQALGAYDINDADANSLAERFPLDGRQIMHAARLAKTLEAGTEVPAAQGIGEAALQQLDDALGGLGVVQRSSLSFDDLVLPDEIRDQIEEIIAAFRNRRHLYQDWGFADRIHRGRGLICLLDGEPGTGKTLTAEVLAGTLGLKLVRVNTSQIIDKYIGETEKHLANLFQRAHPGLDLLLFDEADSLFGKRTKVERSTDRYANAAINVLLQLVEHYEGLVVLTTNLKQGIDPAFERRFTHKIRFPMPEPAHREQIWRRYLPPRAPLAEEIDFEVLAQELELAGGGIKNAIVKAGYLALQQDSALTMEHLLEAGFRELSSSGKLVRQDDWDE